ncbi:MAG: archease [Methanomassiliicoccaceae archaeon]|jgi:SHS2 domain-containing protein|nr:archease [Methanomassiliicoccaceae archaeon]
MKIKDVRIVHMMRYETLEHTADILVKCTGSTLEECFENAAYALFDQMVDIGTIEKKEKFSLTVVAEDAESRLHLFLSELLFMMDADSAVMSSFTVRFNGNEVSCIAHGETLDLRKHRPKTEIKAITYHMMNINENEPSVTVLFDV